MSEPVSERLLAAKFAVPARPDGFVDRRRLVERLQQATERPLTLVSAPAGTGKTVAVSTWASSRLGPGVIVWISLDDADLESAALWSLIVEGLARNGVDITRRAPASGLGAGNRTFLPSLAAQISAHAEPVVLVLDCAGPLTKVDAAGLDQVLRLAGGRLRLVLLTRADPLLPLHRYRLADSMLEIRMADLAFTTDEAIELLAHKGVDLPAQTTDIITGRTRGWAAGLILAAMSLAHRTDPEQAAKEVTGDTGAVAEYLLAEVLDAQPATARELLLSTSVVDVLRPGLVDVLAGPRAQRALTFLAHGNAFLDEIPESAGCYRYHPLFRDLLRAQLSYESPDRALELQRRAAGWMAQHGLLPEAVRHAMAGKAWEDAAQYVVDDLAVGQMLVESPPGAVAEMLAKLPQEPTGQSLSLVRAAAALSALDLDRCARELAAARRQSGPVSAGGADAAAMLAMNLLLLWHARASADTEAALAAAAEVERLVAHVDQVRLESHPEIMAIVASSKGTALLLSGAHDAAAEAFTAGTVHVPRPGCESPFVDCLGHLALLAASGGRLRRAAALAEKAIEIQTEAGVPLASCTSAAETALAWAHAEAWEIAPARHHLLRAEASASPLGDPMEDVVLAIVGARLRRAAGDSDGAMTQLVQAQAKAVVSPWLVDRLRVEEATLEIRSGEPARAATVEDQFSETTTPEAALLRAQARLASGEILEHPVPTPGGSRSTLTVRVDGWLLEAWRRLRKGEEAAAARALDRSLRLAAPERLRRPFREAPREVRQLLRQHEDLTGQHGWLGQDLGGAGPLPRQRDGEPGSASEALIVEPLTEKEREVLGHLAELLTTEEIAAAMFVSVNTVRTHVRNILRKLSASRRNEAVRRARELQLISSPPAVESVPLPRQVTPRG
jgi:LuxR family maltose regulon positive regulatory protein